MKSTIIVVCLVTLIAIGVGLYFVSQEKPTQNTITPLPQAAATTPTTSQKPLPTTSVPNNWKTFTSSQYGFSIRYPQDVSHESNLEGERFYKLGPTQSMETEFYDGISVVIKTGTLEGKTFDEWVNEKYLATKNDPVLERVGDKMPLSIAGTQGISFTVSGLGDSTMIYLPKGENQYLEIVNGTVEPMNREQTYQKIVDTMLSSIQLQI